MVRICLLIIAASGGVSITTGIATVLGAITIVMMTILIATLIPVTQKLSSRLL